MLQADAFSEAVRLNPTDKGAKGNLAAALHKVGDTEEAESIFRSLSEDDPEDARAHFNLAMMLKERNALDDAIAEVRDGVTLHTIHLQRDSAL